MNRIAPSITHTLSVPLALGCIALAVLMPSAFAQTNAEPPATPGAVPTADQPASTAPTLQPPATAGPATPPKFKIDTFVANPEDLLDTNKTLVVPTAYVTLLTHGRVSAVRQSGLFSSRNDTARASANYRVEGLDKAYAQQLAKAALDDFVAQLRGAGYTVLTYADVKDREFMKAAQRAAPDGPMGLPASTEGGNHFITAAPSDEQHFRWGFAGAEFAEFFSAGKGKFTDATLIIPQYTFHAPQAWAGSEAGYKRVSAEANVAEGMNMFNARAPWMGQPKSRMMRGVPGVATKAQVINVTEKAGQLAKTADTTPVAANVLGGVLSMLAGVGNIQRSSGEYVLTVDREAYSRGVLDGVRAFNAEVAKVAAAAGTP